MKSSMLTKRLAGARHDAMKRIALPLVAAFGATACVQVQAPDKPIEINLNVNIRQEVVVSLREDVKNLDQQYPGVF